MVQRIDRLYEQNRELQRQQDEMVQRKREELEAEERTDGRVRRENIAERIAPHLHDEVEISEQAREVARSERTAETAEEAPVPDETLREISDSWYASGYQQAMDQFEADLSA